MSLEGWRAPTGIVARGIGLRWCDRNEGINEAAPQSYPAFEERRTRGFTSGDGKLKNRLDESG